MSMPLCSANWPDHAHQVQFIHGFVHELTQTLAVHGPAGNGQKQISQGAAQHIRQAQPAHSRADKAHDGPNCQDKDVQALGVALYRPSTVEPASTSVTQCVFLAGINLVWMTNPCSSSWLVASHSSRRSLHTGRSCKRIGLLVNRLDSMMVPVMVLIRHMVCLH